MKTEIITQEQARRVPEVGELYTTNGSGNTAFIRIADGIGKKFFDCGDDAVYGIALCNGTIIRHVIAHFTILQPVGGVAKFERV